MGSKSPSQEPVCPISLLSLLLGVCPPLSPTVLVRPNLNPNMAGVTRQKQAAQCTHSSVLPALWSPTPNSTVHAVKVARERTERHLQILQNRTYGYVFSLMSPSSRKLRKALSQRSPCLTLLSNHLYLLGQANCHHLSTTLTQT